MTGISTTTPLISQKLTPISGLTRYPVRVPKTLVEKPAPLGQKGRPGFSKRFRCHFQGKRTPKLDFSTHKLWSSVKLKTVCARLPSFQHFLPIH